MPKNDLRIVERRWRRKPLFHERPAAPARLHTGMLIAILAALALLAWWLGPASLDLISIGGAT